MSLLRFDLCWGNLNATDYTKCEETHKTLLHLSLYPLLSISRKVFAVLSAALITFSTLLNERGIDPFRPLGENSTNECFMP